MDSQTIQCCMTYLLKNSAVSSIYVLARDELSVINFTKMPIAIIVNTDKRKDPGVHFLAFYVYKLNNTLCVDSFDSLGQDPVKYKIYFPLPITSRNTQILQPFQTKTCGLFSLMFIYLRSRGHFMQDIVNRFSFNLNHNNYIVTQFYKKIKMQNTLVGAGQSQICCTRQWSMFENTNQNIAIRR